MTEKPGLTRQTFSSSSASEGDRVPEHGQTPRSSDTLVGVTGAPDPDYHPEAAADAVSDSEAGASLSHGDDSGGIVPLSVMKERAAKPGAKS